MKKWKRDPRKNHTGGVSIETRDSRIHLGTDLISFQKQTHNICFFPVAIRTLKRLHTFRAAAEAENAPPSAAHARGRPD